MSRSTWILLVISVLLTLEVYFFETARPVWQGPGKVFRDVEASEVYEVEISHPAALADSSLGIDARPIVLKYEGQPAAWWLLKPLRCRAFHPRVMGIVYDLVDLVRVAEAPPGAEVFPRGPEISVRLKTRFAGEKRIDVGMDHPDSTLDFCYVRVGDQVFVTKKEFRKVLTVSVEELRSRALVPVALPDATRLSVQGGPRFAKVIERDGDSGRWRLREPLDALADTQLTEDLLRDLNSWTVASFEKDDAKGALDFQPYGLDTPAAVLAVRHRAGTSVALEIGKRFSSGTTEMVYVRHADLPFVYSATAEILGRVLANPEEYRSRYVFELGLEGIVALYLEGQGRKIEIKGLVEEGKSAGAKKATGEPAADLGYPSEWEVEDLSGGGKFPGDKDRIQTLVASLRKLPVQKFVGPEAAPEVTGLSPPLGRLEILLAGGQRAELLVGNRCDDPDYKELDFHYASRPGEPGSYLIQTILPAVLKEGVLSLRRRSISELDAAQLTEFEIRDGECRWSIGRVPGESWGLSVDTPLVAGRELKQAAVDQLTRRLDRREFRVERYLPPDVDPSRCGVELMNSRRAITLQGPADIKGFRKLVLGDRAEGGASQEVYARVDTQGVPLFTLAADDIPRLFEALARHLREITGRQ